MTKEHAESEARMTALESKIVMVVTENPFHDGDEWDRFGYHPKATHHIFVHENIIETIEP